jgi:hypothetical protein
MASPTVFTDLDNVETKLNSVLAALKDVGILAES